MKLFNKSIGIINNETKLNLHSALKKMEAKSSHTISQNGCTFSSTYVTGGILRENNNALYDLRLPIDNQRDRLHGFSDVIYNNKRYIIDNLTGEVCPEKFSLIDRMFGSAKEKLQNISNIIKTVNENFENSDIIQQWSWGIEGVTEKGSKIIEEAKKKIGIVI